MTNRNETANFGTDIMELILTYIYEYNEASVS